MKKKWMEPQRPLEPHQDTMGVPGEKREKWTEKNFFWRYSGIKFPKFDENLLIYLIYWSKKLKNPSRINTKKFTPRHIIAKLLKAKTKRKILKEKKNSLHTGSINMLIADFSSETLEWHIQSAEEKYS